MAKKSKNKNIERKIKEVKIKEVKKIEPEVEDDKETEITEVESNKTNYFKFIYILAGIVLLYLIIAANNVSFINANDEYLNINSTINYNIEYKTLPLSISKTKFYLDNTELNSNNKIFIPDGKHKITIKNGLCEKTKYVYSYNGFVNTTRSNTIIDSDKDGIIDENDNSPFDNDGDDDKYLDGTELVLGLSSDTKDDFTEKRSFEINGNDYTLNITGYGNFTNVIVENVDNDFVNNENVNIYQPIKITAGAGYKNGDNYVKNIKISYKVPDIDKNITIYYFNELNNKYITLDSSIKDGMISAKINKDGIYGLGIKENLTEFDAKNEVAFVIDNSASMFSKEDYETLTGNKYYGAENKIGKDEDQNRINVTKNIIKNLNTKFAVSTTCFNTEVNIINNMSPDFKDTLSNLDNIIYNNTNFGKSKMYSGIEKAISSFDDAAYNKYIVLIADGSNLDDTDIKQKEIVDLINKNNCTLIVFGVNNCNKDLLSQFVKQVNGYYFDINDYDETTTNEIFGINKIKSETLKIEKEDRETIVVADSGFNFEDITKISGFYTKNDNNVSNNSFGIALFADKTINDEIIKTQQYTQNLNINDTDITFNEDYKNILTSNNIEVKELDNVFYKKNKLTKFDFIDIQSLIVDEKDIQDDSLKEIISLDKTKSDYIAGDINYLIENINNGNITPVTLYNNINENTILVYKIYKDKLNPTTYYIEFVDTLDNSTYKIAKLNNIFVDNEQKLLIDYQNYSTIKINKKEK